MMISFSQILQKLKEVFSKMIGTKSIENVLHIQPVMSSQMQNAIQLWEDMYTGHSPWLKNPTYNDPTYVASLGLPQLIASEKARTALLEFESEITTPMKEVETAREDAGSNILERFQQSNTDVSNTQSNNESSSTQQSENNASKQSQSSNFNQFSKYNTSQFHPQATVKELVPKGPTERAEYLNKTYKNKVLKKLRKQIEYGIALGGLVIKPIITENEVTEKIKDKYDMDFDFVYASDFYPLAFNSSGDIVEAAFIQRKIDKDIMYSRLEHHKYLNHTVTIRNMAFRSTTRQGNYGEDLGQEIPLSSVPEWASLEPVTVINDVDRLMFAYFKMPEANTIDIYSPLGVSGFDKAINLIKDADMQYSRLLWEYEGGEMAIDIDRDALRDFYTTDSQGNRVIKSGMGHLQQRLYRPVELTAEGDTYNQFAPTLRDTSYISGLNTILMHIEDVTGLSRGTLSEVDVSEARTATELRILKQRSYQTNAEIQQAIQICLEDLIYVMNCFCDLYEITPDGEYETSFEWDDSILVDVEAELGKRMTLMQNGLMSKKEVRMWYMGETEKQAREALLEVQEENRLAVEDNIMTQMDFNQLGLDSTMQQSPNTFNQ
jgi:A118 family predicted phage portal protein